MASSDRLALRGVFPMLYTPFDAADRVDEDSLRSEVAHVLAHPVAGIAALGLAGEAATLSEAERRRVAAIVLEAAGVRPVVIGCSALDTETTVRLGRHAAERGAAVLMVAPPSRPGIDREDLWRHYTTVAEAVAPTPVMVQDAPAYIGVALDAAFVLALAGAHDNVCYAKTEAVPAGPATAALASGAGARIGVFGGNGALYLLDQLAAGAVGVIPGSELPAVWAAIVASHAAGDEAAARENFRRVLPLIVFELQTLDFYIACGKEILRRQGVLSHAALRGGRSPLGAWEFKRLGYYLDEVNCAIR